MATDKQKEQGELLEALQDAVNSGSLSKDLLLKLTEQFGLEAAQELVCARTTALRERAEALRLEEENGSGSVHMLFTDEFAKETGNWPRPADYI